MLYHRKISLIFSIQLSLMWPASTNQFSVLFVIFKLLLSSLLVLSSWTDILENLGRNDLELIRIQLEVEKTKRLQLQSDLEVMMLKIETLNIRFDQRGTNGNNLILHLSKCVCASTTVPGGGTTYVRWGRTTCPEMATELVYKGYMAVSEYTQTGNGPNNICLPEDPTWAKYQDGTFDGDHRGRVYDTEYEIGGGSTYTPFSPDLYNNDVPCAVCRTTQYVCLDGNPEYIDGGIANTNGHVIYQVEVICGALRCPPYVNGRELACVVCSK
ncbi:hypothetical protein ACJMK2_032279 [Sinanodonta woodiana]|uniref:Short-chain collagen C4 n=1 Tax=Sinanodonta woodiana TaxID=1069815 RepID=A0ABD3X193_SINWO